MKKLITEATRNGALAEPEADNDYVREIGRIGRMCAAYEDMCVDFEHLTVRKREPVVSRSILPKILKINKNILAVAAGADISFISDRKTCGATS